MRPKLRDRMVTTDLEALAQRVSVAARSVARSSSLARDDALRMGAEQVLVDAPAILASNVADLRKPRQRASVPRPSTGSASTSAVWPPWPKHFAPWRRPPTHSARC